MYERKPVLDPAPVASAGERAWRRASLWLLPVLITLLLAMQGYGSVQRWLSGKELIGHDIAAGQQAEYGGSRWRLKSLRSVSMSAEPGIPESSAAVVVELEVEVGEADLPVRWKDCAISLVGADGTRWAPTEAAGLRLPPDMQFDCQKVMHAGAAQGDVLRVREVFLLPSVAAADRLRVAVSLGVERPRYLRLAAQQPQ